MINYWILITLRWIIIDKVESNNRYNFYKYKSLITISIPSHGVYEHLPINTNIYIVFPFASLLTSKYTYSHKTIPKTTQKFHFLFWKVSVPMTQPIHNAAKSGDVEGVREALSAGVDVHTPGNCYNYVWNHFLFYSNQR